MVMHHAASRPCPRPHGSILPKPTSPLQSPSASLPKDAALLHGRVVSALGHRALIAWTDARGQETTAMALSQGRDPGWTTGDLVLFEAGDPPVVKEVLPRRNRVSRHEAGKQRTLAANIDEAWVVVSGHPLFSPDAVSRLLLSLLAQDIPVRILATKADLPEAHSHALALLEPMLPMALQDRILALSSHTGAGLPSLIAGAKALAVAMDRKDSPCRAEGAPLAETSLPQILVAGPSGMGKSSLLNALIPGLALRTQEISEALQTGRHTTTASTAHRWQPAGSDSSVVIIDTPGFQRWGIEHLQTGDLRALFPDLAEVLAQNPCRFRNCQHRDEPGCGLLAWANGASVMGHNTSHDGRHMGTPGAGTGLDLPKRQARLGAMLALWNAMAK